MKITKRRKRLRQTQLQTELAETLKQMLLPSRKVIEEQTERLIEQHFIVRNADVVNTFAVYPLAKADSCITSPLSSVLCCRQPTPSTSLVIVFIFYSLVPPLKIVIFTPIFRTLKKFSKVSCDRSSRC